jgi:hypothetical protein
MFTKNQINSLALKKYLMNALMPKPFPKKLSQSTRTPEKQNGG